MKKIFLFLALFLTPLFLHAAEKSIVDYFNSFPDNDLKLVNKKQNDVKSVRLRWDRDKSKFTLKNKFST